MSKKGKVLFGIITIIWSFVSSGIGLWVLSNMPEHQFIMTFFLMTTPCITTLAIINLLKENK